MQNFEQGMQEEQQEPEEITKDYNPKPDQDIERLEKECMFYFLGCMEQYRQQRQQYELLWQQANAVYELDASKIDKLYQGNSNMFNPVMRIKVRNLVARMNRILFNVKPWGRIQDKKLNSQTNKSLVELWNSFIFDSQIPEIEFEKKFRSFLYGYILYGFGVAKVPQVSKYSEIDRYGTGEFEEVKEYDNTDFVPIIPQSFYSDATCPDIQESSACIHHTTVKFQNLYNQRLQIEETITEIQDQFGNTVQQTERELIGCYKNLDKIQSYSSMPTQEAQDYLNYFNVSPISEPISVKPSLDSVKEKTDKYKKTGSVDIIECWGKYWFPNDKGELEWTEVVLTIANGFIPIRFERNDFGHRYYKRPFVACNMDPMPEQLYSKSNVILGLNLYAELNANRQQRSDAITASIFPMIYEDRTKQVRWDGKYKPFARIQGNGPNGLVPLVNPYLGHVSDMDSREIMQDLDMLFNLSPVQQGTTDSRLIPSTARGTAAVIAQNDIALNDSINNLSDSVLKPFLEIIFERNIRFKDIKDLLDVWEVQDIAYALQKSGYKGDLNNINDLKMKDLMIEPKISLLGNMELSNEISHQAGWMAFYNLAMQNPTIAKRVKWPEVANKLLQSFGIKDDSENVFFTEEELQAANEQEQQYNAQQQAMQQQAMQLQQQKDMLPLQLKQQELAFKQQEIASRQAIDMQHHRNDVQGHALKEVITTQEIASRDANRIGLETRKEQILGENKNEQ